MKAQNFNSTSPTDGLSNEEKQQNERRAMLGRIEASNAGQEKYARKQYRMTQISMLSNLAVLGIVIYIVVTLLPKVTLTLRNLNYIMNDLQTVSSQLAEVDFEGMVEDVDTLVNESNDSLNTAMRRLNSIDFETLNKAIKNLNDTVEPLAKFFNRF